MTADSLTRKAPRGVGWWITAVVLGLACSHPTADAGPRRITAVTPLQLTGVVATEVSPAPAVRVTDGDGAPVAGAGAA